MILSEIATTAPKDISKREVNKLTRKLLAEMQRQQRRLYASLGYSVLVVLQGMDAAGKDGTIRNVFGPLNPQGCRVKSYKKPTEREYAQDFLWRVHQHTPALGFIHVFNRSHYEDIIVPTVFKLFNVKLIEQRYGLINAFEQLLTHQRCIIFKFYLHVSAKEQMVRLNDRTKNPDKFWKHNPRDHDVAKMWPQHTEVYERIFKICSPELPWTIVPADDKWYRNYIVAKTVVEKLRGLNIEYPPMADSQK